MLRPVVGIIAALFIGGSFVTPFTAQSVAAQDPIECDKAGSEECKDDESSNMRVRDHRNSDSGGCPEGQKLIRVRKTVDGERITTYECRKPSSRTRDNPCPEGQTRVRVTDKRDGESTSRTVCMDDDAVRGRRDRSTEDDDTPVPTRSDAAKVEGARDMGDIPAISSEGPAISMEEEDDQPTSVTSTAGRLAGDEQKICCIDFYSKPVGFMMRKECTDSGGDVAAANRCVREVARDIGDPPVNSDEAPVYEEEDPFTITKHYGYNGFGQEILKYSCIEGQCWCGGAKDFVGNYVAGNCTDMKLACENNGSENHQCWEADEDYKTLADCDLLDTECRAGNEGLNQFPGCSCSWE